MADRTTKFLLAIIALLLIALLICPALTVPAAEAQTTAMKPVTASQMIVEKHNVYIFQNGKLTVYGRETGYGQKSYLNVRLRELATQNVTAP